MGNCWQKINYDSIYDDIHDMDLKEDSKECANELLEKESDVYKELRSMSKQFDTNPIILNKDVQQEFNKYKKYSKITKKPFIQVSMDLKKNKLGVLNTIGLDIPIKSLNKDDFIKRYSNLIGIPKSHIKILSLKEGSVIIEMWITDDQKYDIGVDRLLEKTIKDPKVQKKLNEMKAFCLLFDSPRKKPGWENSQSFRTRLVSNTQYDRIYDDGEVCWNGSLDDGKNRGKFPYFCPKGWVKKAVSHKFFTADDFDNKFKGWPIAYHGTEWELGLSILLSGLIASDTGAYGGGVYLTPSIIYAAHPRYARVKKLTNDEKKNLNINNKANYIQFVLMCRVKPDSIHTIKTETLGADDSTIDKNHPNNTIEWVVDGPGFMENPESVDCKVFVVGVMIRLTDEHPYLLDESDWWKFCPCGVPDEARRKKNQGIKATIYRFA